MKLYARMVIVLTTIGLVSGALLVAVGMFTRERIAFNRQKEIEEAILQVVPGTHASHKVYEEKDFAVYEGKDENDRLLGFAIRAAAGGFQDKILILIGTNAEFLKINGLYIIDQKETPGLGAKITSREFFLQFWEGKDFSRSLSLRRPPVEKDKLGPSEVNAITGATVSSEAVLGIVNISLEKIKKMKDEGRFSGEGKDAK